MIVLKSRNLFATIVSSISSSVDVSQLLQNQADISKSWTILNISKSTNVTKIYPGDDFKVELIILLTMLTLILFLMITILILPKSVQDVLFHIILRQNPDQSFNYIDVGLYKTRHSIYRKEIYSLVMQGNRTFRRNKSTDLRTNQEKKEKKLKIQTRRFKQSEKHSNICDNWVNWNKYIYTLSQNEKSATQMGYFPRVKNNLNRNQSLSVPNLSYHHSPLQTLFTEKVWRYSYPFNFDQKCSYSVEFENGFSKFQVSDKTHQKIQKHVRLEDNTDYFKHDS